MNEAESLLGLLAEEERLRAFAALLLGARTLAEVADAAGLSARAAAQALSRLDAGGLASVAGDVWSAHPERLKNLARAAAPDEAGEDFGESAPERAAVLRRFLHEGRLTQIPAARGKRLVVLDHIAQVFEPGVRYPEREVNAYLRAFHPDVAALRRYLVDERILSREHGVYWRTGGSVVV